jgi:ferrochelatase
MWTEEQAEGLRRLLKSNGDGDSGGHAGVDVRVEIGMRSAEPSIESALRNLKEWGAQRLVLLPLFPHFSTTTTGTCLEEAESALARMNWSPLKHEVRNWPDEPGYAALLRRTVDEAIARAEEERGDAADPIHVLFSAHSLPLKIVERGDTYPEDIARTIKSVTDGLKHPWSLCFQSRNGKMAWLEPYLEDELKRLGRGGVRRVVVAPVSFVSDHIETLFELDQLYAEEARRSGITHYYRARSFNGDPEFAEVLRAILRKSGV